MKSRGFHFKALEEYYVTECTPFKLYSTY